MLCAVQDVVVIAIPLVVRDTVKVYGKGPKGKMTAGWGILRGFAV